VPLDGRSRIITIELSKLRKVVKILPKEMNVRESWAVFFRYLTDKKKRQIINEIIKLKEGIAMAAEVLMTISRDEVERVRLMSEEKRLLDIQSKLVNAKRQGEAKAEKKWQKVVAEKDATIADKDAEIARLREQLKNT